MDRDALISLSETQHGVVARRQLRQFGFDPHAVHRLAASPQWDAVTPEVFRRVGSSRTRTQSVMIAVLDAGAGAVLSHSSAGRWWGLGGCSLLPAHVTLVGASRRRSGLSVPHRVRSLPTHWTTTLRGVPVVRPELLALQLFATCSAGRAERLTDRLWSDRLLSGASIDRFVAELGRRGRNGTAGLRDYLEQRGSTYVPPASGLESRFMVLAADAGVPMRRQVDLGGDGWTGRVDFLHAVLPIVVEVQSERHHTALCDVEADRHRIAGLRAAGFEVVEIWDTDIWTRPEKVVRELVAVTLRAQNPGSVMRR